MRTILFRGKRTDNGEWVYGAAVKTALGDGYYILARGVNCKSYSVEQDTIGQYIGLDDRNGKPIYEGDIVMGMFDHNKITGWIVYGSDAKFFIQRKGLYGIGLNNAEDWVEVIGNIYDNPELLEVTENVT